MLAIDHVLQMELQLLQESQRKTAELAKLGQVLEKKGEQEFRPPQCKQFHFHDLSFVVAATRKEVCIGADCGLEEKTEATGVSIDGNFLDDVMRVLLNARRVLSASYCIGYFIPPESKDMIQGHDTLQVVMVV